MQSAEAQSRVLTRLLVFLSDALLQLGVPRAAIDDVFTSYGVDREAPERRVSFLALKALWETAERTLGDRPVGLDVVPLIERGARDIVDYLLQSAANIQQLTELALQVSPHFDETSAPSMVPHPRGICIVCGRVPGVRVSPAMSDYAVARLLDSIRVLTGQAAQPLEVFLSRPEPDDRTRHDEVFGCPVRFGHTFDGVVLDVENWDAPLPRTDTQLHNILARHIDLRSPRSVSERVERVLLEGLTFGGSLPGQEEVARHLGMAPRTLRRELTGEGTSFARLVDRVRQLSAQDALLAGEAVVDVALRLGFASQAAFTRAFKRWTGAPPAAWARAALQGPI